MKISSGLRALAVCFLALSFSGSAWSDAVTREDRIKAALIFKLVKFVDWPPQTLLVGSPMQFCVVGTGGVGEALGAADGKPVRDRTLKYRRLEGLVGDVRGCHVLFIPAGRDAVASIPAQLRQRGSGVLTISDQPDFARRGGMIGLTQGENKVGFEINLRVTREAGMEPGASLLELANIVD